MSASASLAEQLASYEWATLSEALRDLAEQSRHCVSPAGGRIPTWPLLEAASRLNELEGENAKLRGELKHIAAQVPAKDMDEDYYDAADFEHGYDSLIFVARAALGLKS